MAQHVIWVFDTSSIIEIRRSIENTRKQGVFNSMSTLVVAGRLVFPIEVVKELERFADPKLPDAQYLWAKEHEEMAKAQSPSFEEVKDILSIVPDVLDPDRDSGEEEADPYVLAVARRLRSGGGDGRVVTQETKDTPRKISMNSACGLLGMPSVPLTIFLRFEGIL
ncbi:MAG: DUF4411 family protein [Candidatus Sulfotelmatobacter sp.]